MRDILEAVPLGLAVVARSAGKGFHTRDGYIAANATAHGFEVATGDASAFRAPGVPVIDLWKGGQ